MDPYETKEGDYLVQRWKKGDRLAWAPLRHLIEKRLLERVTEISGVHDPEKRVRLNRTVLETFDKLLTEGRLSIEKRGQYDACCAYALRHVLVDMESQADAITDATATIDAQFHKLR